MKNLLNIINEHKGIISIIGGSVFATVGAVMIKKASLKCETIMKEYVEVANMIEECAVNCSSEEYSEEDKQMDTFKNAINTIIKKVKLFLLPVTVLLTSVYIICNGFFIVYKKRPKYEGGAQYE